MVWISLFVLLVLTGGVVFQRNKNRILERELAALKEQQTVHGRSVETQAQMLSSYKEMLDSQKALLAAYKDRLDGLADDAALPAQRLESSTPDAPVHDEALEQRQRETLAAEKNKFEKEFQEKKKNMDWYEKEFRVALSALIELFLQVPRNKQEAIIARMPASVIKKGFKRLSDCL